MSKHERYAALRRSIVVLLLIPLNGPSITTVTLSNSYVMITGPSVPYLAALANTGPSLPGVYLQGYIQQGPASRAAGGGPKINCGAGVGVLPTTPSCGYSFSVSASNATSGVGKLGAGAATLRLDMISVNGAKSSVVATKSVPVTLVHPGVTIVTVIPVSTSPHLNGPDVSYTATLSNTTGTTYTGTILQASVSQGGAHRSAGGSKVSCGGPVGSFPLGLCIVSFSYAARNSNAGSGALVPGPATLHFELFASAGMLDTRNVPITILP